MEFVGIGVVVECSLFHVHTNSRWFVKISDLVYVFSLTLIVIM